MSTMITDAAVRVAVSEFELHMRAGTNEETSMRCAIEAALPHLATVEQSLTANPDGDEAWAIAELVRTDLDRQSCPDAYMRIAVESVVKHLTAAPAECAHVWNTTGGSNGEARRSLRCAKCGYHRDHMRKPEVGNSVSVSERERFEAWCDSIRKDRSRCGDGYVWFDTDMAWFAWQECRRQAALQPVGGVVGDPEDFWRSEIRCVEGERNSLAEAIVGAGVKRGMLREGEPFTGPQLIHICQALAAPPAQQPTRGCHDEQD